MLIDLGMVGHTRPAMQQNLLARVESKFLLFGYPGLAILCFTTAAAGSFWLVISIFFHDYKSRKKQMR